MSSPIERVRYYEGEYLGSGDFDAEQAYHIEMRRRMNHALHLSGIVYGLELKQVDEGAGIFSYNIGKGLAIDHEGREIFLFSARQIDATDLQRNLIGGVGDYEVWLQYRKDPDVPPSAGYGQCNESGQYTRWAESAEVVIVGKGSKGKAWRPTDPVPDDNGLPGVIVGIISVNGNLEITKVTPPLNPEYIGLRAQRIKAPVNPQAFSIANQNSALNPPVSLGIETNVFAEKNLIVGDDFAIPGTGKLVPPPPGFPSARGNLKVAGNLFLQGDMYAYVAPDWLGLKEFVATLIPDVKVGTVQPPGLQSKGTNLSADILKFSIDTKNAGPPQIVLAVSEITWLSINDFTSWKAAAGVGKTTAHSDDAGGDEPDAKCRPHCLGL